MTRRNRNTHARLAAWLLGAVLATAPTLALAHGPEAKAVKARLAQNTERAVERGAFGIPTFFVDGEMWFGKERLGQLEDFLGGGQP